VRERWFLPGTAGDIGLSLLAIWLAVQANPGIRSSPRCTTSAARPVLGPVPTDVAAMLVESAQSAFQLLGVGLFVALLVRERTHVAGAVLLLVGAAAIVKGVAALALLSPAVGEHWLTPGVALGIGVGALLLAVAIRLPRSVQVTLATIALLSSLLATLFVPRSPVRACPSLALQRLLRAPAQFQRPHAHGAAAVAGDGERVPVRAGRTARMG
jgi:hypothetical protein